MPLSNCERCGKMYSKSGETKVCPTCMPAEEEDFEKVRDELERSPNLTAEQLSERTEVDLPVVFRLMEMGRIQDVSSKDAIRCGRCGAPAISLSKKLCEACLNKINNQIAVQQGKVKLPKRKEVELGIAMNAPEEKGEPRKKARGLDFRNR